MATPRQTGRLMVEVVCAGAATGFARPVLVPVGQTIGWAANASGVYGLHPHLRGCALGLWGKRMPPETLAAEGDRIELYLPCDPAAVARARNLKRTVASGGISADKNASDERNP